MIPDEYTRSLYLSELDLFPFFKIMTLLGFFAWTVFMTLVKGGRDLKSMVDAPFCSMEFWGLYSIYIASCFAFSYFYTNKMNKKDAILKGLKGVPMVSSFDLDENKVKVLMTVAFQAGCLGGMLGLGGGVILCPIWLEMGFVAQEVTVTSILAVVFVSGTSSFQAIVGGYLGNNEIMIFGIVSYVSSLIIAIFLRWVV